MTEPESSTPKVEETKPEESQSTMAKLGRRLSSAWSSLTSSVRQVTFIKRSLTIKILPGGQTETKITEKSNGDEKPSMEVQVSPKRKLDEVSF